MQRMSRLDASRAILRDHPDALILMLTLYATSQVAEQSKKHGIKALCSKAQVKCITQAIRGLLKGEIYSRNHSKQRRPGIERKTKRRSQLKQTADRVTVSRIIKVDWNPATVGW